MMCEFILAVLVTLILTGFFALPLWFFTLAYGLLLIPLWLWSPEIIFASIASGAFAILVFLNLKPLRAKLISSLILKIFQRLSPKISKTEAEALGAGTVGFEGDLFCGRPDYKKLLNLSTVQLSKEEQDFLDGPVEELCAMSNDYDISVNGDLPPKIWQFLKDQGFFGLIIPKKYGGKEFSAWAHAAIIMKAESQSIALGVSISVPNSLGPAELILKYGSEEQKNYYLKRLALGQDIPCFALTGPSAGSDASSIPDEGIVCYDNFNGEKTLGLRLNWDKRYITLAPMATVIGLAFKMSDPSGLLGEKKDYGITCALVPANLPGVTVGPRHNPLDIVFQNGPTKGKDVFIPIDYIIGGQKMAGHGWKMLMECLSAGRAITLPSSACAGASISAFASGAYARTRHQFGLPIGRFEGIQEALARLANNAYINTSALKFTLAAVDRGEEPPVASAIIKYHCTERGRQSINDAMDIHGGKGICKGRKNYLANWYNGIPINITVEGANILTRNLIIFGQGALRCHPFLMKELQASQKNDVRAFDEAIFSHAGYVFSNSIRSFILSLSGSFLANAPSGKLKRHFQHLSRYSSTLSLVADVCAVSLGSDLKRKERISARLGDVLSYLYLASAVLKRFKDDGQKPEDLPLAKYACDHLFYECQKTFYELFSNLPNKFLGQILKFSAFPLGLHRQAPSDKLAHEIAEILLKPNESLDRLTSELYFTDHPNNHLSLLKKALIITDKSEALEKKIRKLQKQGQIKGANEIDLVNDALAKNLIQNREHEQLIEVAKIREKIIAVDDFSSEDLKRKA